MSNQFQKLFQDLIMSQVSVFNDKVDIKFMIDVLEDVIKMLKNATPSSVTCTGCIENQPNQLAHMDYGGCMYDCEDLV